MVGCLHPHGWTAVISVASMDAGGPNGQPFEHGRAAFELGA